MVQYTRRDRRFFRKSGSIGGKKGAANMTPAERKERARKASNARWGKKAGKSPQKPHDQLSVTAHHEAAHAVFSLLFGRGFEYVTIVSRGGINGTHGHTRHFLSPELLQHISNWNNRDPEECFAPSGRFLLGKEDISTRRQLNAEAEGFALTLTAGYAAEWFLYGQEREKSEEGYSFDEDADIYSLGDYTEAVAATSLFCLGKKECILFVEMLKERSRNICSLPHVWRAIASLARELLKKHKMNRTTAERIVKAAVLGE